METNAKVQLIKLILNMRKQNVQLELDALEELRLLHVEKKRGWWNQLVKIVMDTTLVSRMPRMMQDEIKKTGVISTKLLKKMKQ